MTLCITKNTLQQKFDAIEFLQSELSVFSGVQKKTEWLLSHIENVLEESPDLKEFVRTSDDIDLFVICILAYLGEWERISIQGQGSQLAIQKIASFLAETERFYDSIGGLLGYISTVARLFLIRDTEELPDLSAPPIFNMTEENSHLWKYCYEAMRRFSELGEVFTVGGAGDRLGLVDDQTNKPIPVAYLQFGGFSLLEGLFRDLQAREYWHYRVFGAQCTLPVVLMTSREKNNSAYIRALCEEKEWFFRPKESISFVTQGLVPMVTDGGDLVCSGPMELLGKPGGHGVLWKLLEEEKIFSKLEEKGVTGLVVRQINNPLGGLDYSLLSLAGIGLREKKAFGFVGCPQRPGFAEGLLALVLEGNRAHISNIEYTKFEAVKKQNEALLEEGGACPANTNILFAQIASIRKALKEDAIPGLVINAKTGVEVIDEGGRVVKSAARLESTMQNVADKICDSMDDFQDAKDQLSTFVVLYNRNKSMSVTKRAFSDIHVLHETTISCFYDLYIAHRALLKRCAFSMPEKQSFESFVAEGPNVLFYFNPALGPLWEVISQKINGGTIAWGSEIELEIAEVYVQSLSVRGSFRLLADSPLGPVRDSGGVYFQDDVARAYVKNVTVENEGMLSASLSEQVKRDVSHGSSCTIRLQGCSELIAEDITIRGNFELTVPDGKRIRLIQGKDGKITSVEEPYLQNSWEYRVEWKEGMAPVLEI